MDSISTCFAASTETSRIIASYSHLIPVVLSLVLSFFVFIKSKYNLFSKIFLSFIIIFSLWLVGDYVIWTSNKYNLIYAIWAALDFIEILFYTLSLYFILVFLEGKDISLFKKSLLLLINIPGLLIVLLKKALIGFNYPVCEALSNGFFTNYKLIIESLILFIMLFSIIVPFIKRLPWEKKKANLILIGSMFAFLTTFGVTEYISSNTGFYELNLYSLFLLPLLIIAIIYSVFELDIFNFKMLGTQYLVVGFVILMGGQLFFVNGTADRLLTVATFIISFGLALIMFRNFRRETNQRIHIEKLSVQLEDSKMRLENSNMKLENANEKLKSLDKLKTEFLSLASHQLRSPLTAIKGYTSMLLEGDFGKVNSKQSQAINRVFESSKHLTKVVEDLLNVAKIEQGGMQYVMSPFDFEKVVRDLENDLSITAKNKGLQFTFETDKKSPYTVNGDMEKLRQVILNLTDNAIKYTKEGSIKVKLLKDEAKKKIRLEITDTGMGTTPEIKATLFQKFARGEGGKMNAGGSGLGLYLAKEITKAHKGVVGVDSPGPGKGSTFYLELDAEAG